MSNYTKTTNFAAKDSLPSGNAAKIVKGTEIDTEFNNIATASATKANANNAALTGTTVFETLSDGTLSITGWVDEDNMSSDSASLVPTQQSVKAYVDSQVTAQDLDVTDGSTSIDIDLDSESLGILGGTGIDSTASGTGVTLAIDATVATLAGTQTLSNKTLSTPVVSGNLTTDGLLDGRDVATDGAKLDGIESGATADQTAAEIKTAYESNSDTNAFTDADESKLDGIEASADVTDTANVTAAGALMDSELTSEASVKALNQGVATTDSPTFAGVTAPVTGNVTGNLTGNVTGNVTGNLTGDVTGDVTGDLTGSVLTAAQTNITSVGTLGSLTVSGDVTVDTNSLKVDSTNNRVGILNASPDVSLDVGSATDAMHVPVGTTAQRPGSPAAGYFRYNSTTGGFEGYTDAWGAIAGGGGGVAPSIDTMTGDGSDTTLALTNAPVNENATFVTIDGVTQHKSTYSVSGTTLTFSTAPPTGSAVEAITLNTTTINTASILQDADGDTKVQVEESSDEDKIRFDTAGTERAVIDSSGLDVTGTVTADDAVIQSDGAAVTVSSADHEVALLGRRGSSGVDLDKGFFRLKDTGTTKVAIDSAGDSYFNGGNVGIGTSSPTRALSVFGDTAGVISITSNSTDGISSLSFGDTADDNAGRVNYLNASDAMLFYTAATERLRIDSAGRVGIGTSSPLELLHVQNGSTGGSAPSGADEVLIEGTSTTVGLTLLASNSAACNIVFQDTDGTAGVLQYDHASNFMSFTANGSEAMRIDSSGNLLVGKTTTDFGTVGIRLEGSNGKIESTRNNNVVMALNRLSTDGSIVNFSKDGTTVGSIGVVGGNNLYIHGDTIGLGIGDDNIYPTNSSGTSTDAITDIGDSSARFRNVYRSGSTISTSDRNMKQDIRDLTDAERNVAVAAKGLLKAFRFIDRVEQEGDSASIHFGIIAQDLAAAFTAEGLDANDYQVYRADTFTDDDGNEQTRLGICYENLLAFIIAAI